MKKIDIIICWIVLILIFAFCTLGPASAQTLSKYQFKSTVFASGATQYRWGWLYTPAGTGKHPVIIFFHGTGEAGASCSAAAWTDGDANKLLTWGPLYFVNKGWHPDYVIISMQETNFSPSVSAAYTAITKDPKISALIDTSEMLITGLSAGGQRTMEWMQVHPSSLTAFIPMSPAGDVVKTGGLPLSYTWWCWVFNGNNDPTVGITNATNIAKLAAARFTIYQGGHGGWNTFYDPVYVDPVYLGNIYTWAFAGFGQLQPPIVTPPSGPIKIGELYKIDSVTWQIKFDSPYK